MLGRRTVFTNHVQRKPLSVSNYNKQMFMSAVLYKCSSCRWGSLPAGSLTAWRMSGVLRCWLDRLGVRRVVGAHPRLVSSCQPAATELTAPGRHEQAIRGAARSRRFYTARSRRFYTRHDVTASRTVGAGARRLCMLRHDMAVATTGLNIYASFYVT